MGEGHLYTPEALDDSPRSGLICFLSEDRVCGADCMAWSTQPSGPPSLSDDQRHCVLLCTAERLGRHSGLIAQGVRELSRSFETEPGGEG